MKTKLLTIVLSATLLSLTSVSTAQVNEREALLANAQAEAQATVCMIKELDRQDLLDGMEISINVFQAVALDCYMEHDVTVKSGMLQVAANVTMFSKFIVNRTFRKHAVSSLQSQVPTSRDELGSNAEPTSIYALTSVCMVNGLDELGYNERLRNGEQYQNFNTIPIIEKCMTDFEIAEVDEIAGPVYVAALVGQLIAKFDVRDS